MLNGNSKLLRFIFTYWKQNTWKNLAEKNSSLEVSYLKKQQAYEDRKWKQESKIVLIDLDEALKQSIAREACGRSA